MQLRKLEHVGTIEETMETICCVEILEHQEDRFLEGKIQVYNNGQEKWID